ncbi:MAG: hypothetical protein IJ759_07575 [Bacteroidales bacterium]|nr:hypothetical protein [Bacteroidales bacterium]
MTEQELIEKTTIVYDEYQPSQIVDEDIKTFLREFLSDHFNDYLLLLPAFCINKDFVIDRLLSGISIQPINYKGGKIALSFLAAPFLKLLTFKHSEWQTKLFSDDLSEGNDPARKLQDSKWTSGKTSRPFICLEHSGGENCLCFGGYKNNLNDIEEFTYIKRVSSFKEFLKLEDDLLNAYIYYVVFCFWNNKRNGTSTKCFKSNEATAFFKEYLSDYANSIQ